MSETGIPLPMVGHDGNAFAILGKARQALIDHDRADLVDRFIAEARAGDYDHLLQTCIRWFDCDGKPEPVEDQ